MVVVEGVHDARGEPAMASGVAHETHIGPSDLETGLTGLVGVLDW